MNVSVSNYASLCCVTHQLWYDIDYLDMRDEGGLVKVEIACFGQHRR